VVVQDLLHVLVARDGEHPLAGAPDRCTVHLQDRRLIAHGPVVRVGALDHIVIGGVEGNGVGHRAIHSSRIAWK